MFICSKVYKGTIANGQMAAIKRAQQGSMQGAAEFKNEIELLSRVHHKNLVSLVGFCYEQGEQMLVYEYIPNGTLRENLMGNTHRYHYQHIFTNYCMFVNKVGSNYSLIAGKGGMHLDWMTRLRIAIGSAKGLAYLHELANPPIIHRDIKSTNILLDESLTAKVADFGLSKLLSDTQKGHVSTQVKGTLVSNSGNDNRSAYLLSGK
jgi:serine/threonine protein kinase